MKKYKKFESLAKTEWDYYWVAHQNAIHCMSTKFTISPYGQTVIKKQKKYLYIFCQNYSNVCLRLFTPEET